MNRPKPHTLARMRELELRKQMRAACEAHSKAMDSLMTVLEAAQTGEDDDKRRREIVSADTEWRH